MEIIGLVLAAVLGGVVGFFAGRATANKGGGSGSGGSTDRPTKPR